LTISEETRAIKKEGDLKGRVGVCQIQQKWEIGITPGGRGGAKDQEKKKEK